jgi:hypothetical protein
MSDVSTGDVTTVAGASLGGPGSPDAARCSLAAIEALSRVAGVDMRLTQIQLDVSSHAIGQNEVAINARIDKRTRSIVFASVEARAADELVFRAQALFSRRGS